MEHWDDIRLFLAVARHGQMTAAARALGVQQSTVSRRIAGLEERLGATLFERTPEGLHLTTLANQWLHHAEKIELHTLKMQALVEQHESQPKGLVRLALTESVANYVIIPRLHHWREKYPNIRVELQTSYSNADLVRREADIAIRFTRPEQGDLTIKKLAELSLGIFGHTDYIQAHRHDSLEALDWIIVELGEDMTLERQWLGAHLGSINTSLMTNSYIAQIEAMRQGLGVGLVASQLANRFPDLQAWPTALVPPTLTMWLVTQPALRHVPRIDAIWTEILELIQRW